MAPLPPQPPAAAVPALNPTAPAEEEGDAAPAPAAAGDATLLPPAAPAAPVPVATPAPSAPAAVEAAPLHHAAEQVAVAIKRVAKEDGVDRIAIQLKPASLGAVDVQLSLAHDGRVSAVISAERPETLHLLQRDAGGLEQALRDAGLRADSGSLSFNLRGDGRSFSQGAPPGQAEPSRAYAPGYDDASTDLPAPSLRRHAGSLDIHV
jgi:flagellar hook-length control protein FliK